MQPRSTTSPLLTGAFFLIALAPKATADALAYANLSGTVFGIQDLTNGTFTQLGSNSGLVGLGEVGGTLYGALGDTLYTVDPANGDLTTVGSGSATFEEFGSTTGGLFGLDYSMNLYSIDPTTGASTLIGPTGLSLPFHNGLSAGSSTLYFAEEANQNTGPAALYSLNTLTGAATLIGSNSTTSAVFGPVFVDGVLYAASCGNEPACGFAPTSESIYTLDTTTGAAAFVAASTATNIPDGMAPVLTPEPSSALLLAAAGTLIGVIARRRRQNQCAS